MFAASPSITCRLLIGKWSGLWRAMIYLQTLSLMLFLHIARVSITWALMIALTHKLEIHRAGIDSGRLPLNAREHAAHLRQCCSWLTQQLTETFSLTAWPVLNCELEF